MSGVIIAGNTSGSVTLDAPAVSGSTVITLPTASGTMVATDTSGNVGIGTTPGAWNSAFKAIQMPNGVSFAGYSGINDVSAYVYSNAIYSTSGINYVVNDFASVYQQYNGEHIWETAPSGTAGGAITFTRGMTLDASGQFYLGSTQSAQGKFSLKFSQASNQAIVVQNTNAGNAGNFYYMMNSAGGGAGTISQTGAATVNYGSGSDYRLKENIQPMSGALSKVALLKPCTYTWKVDGTNGQGFIAHELQEVVPDAVVGEKDAVNEDGSIKTQMVDTSLLVATLTAAIQELKAIVDTQAEQIKALQGVK
jgi:hypothetical protein